MDLLKVLYFITLVVYVLQCIFARRIKLNWALIIVAVVIHSIYFFGWEGVAFILVTGVVSTAAELISLKTPFNIFGVSYKYDLSNNIFPSKIVFGKVYPIEVTAAWILLKYLSFFLVSFIAFHLNISVIIKALLSALVLVSFDLLLDPYAVFQGAWKWSKPGKFFEIPWRNFLGWFVVGFIISLIFINLKPIEMRDTAMIIPVFVVCALFPGLLGGKLISLSKIKGIIALLPLVFFIIVGLSFLFP